MWLLFAILSTLFWGSTNSMDAGIRRHFVKNDFAISWFFMITRLPIAVFLLFWFRDFVNFDLNFLLVVLAGILWSLPIFLYYKAIEIEEVSRVVIFMQLIPIFALILAWIFLDEILSLNQFLAFILIFVGGILAATRKIEGLWKFSKAFVFIFFAAFAWAFSDIMFKFFQPGFLGFWPAFSVYLFGSGFLSVLLFVFPKKRKKVLSLFENLPLRVWFLLIFTNFVGILGSLTFAYALILGKVALAAVIIGIQPIFSFAFGHLFSKFVQEIPAEPFEKKALIFKGASLGLVLIGLIVLNFF